MTVMSGQDGKRMIDREELEDRARALLTRRRFLFLGAAAAGAAILKPPPLWTPTVTGPYVIGAWADYPTMPTISEEVWAQQRTINGILRTESAMVTYYDMKSREAIKKRIEQKAATPGSIFYIGGDE